MKKIVVLILLGFSLISYARLGESPAKCEQRYGKPTWTSDENSSKKLLSVSKMMISNKYNVNGSEITIIFGKNKAVFIQYWDPNISEAAKKDLFFKNTNIKYEDWEPKYDEFKKANPKAESFYDDNGTGFQCMPIKGDGGGLVICTKSYLVQKKIEENSDMDKNIKKY